MIRFPFVQGLEKALHQVVDPIRDSPVGEALHRFETWRENASTFNQGVQVSSLIPLCRLFLTTFAKGAFSRAPAGSWIVRGLRAFGYFESAISAPRDWYFIFTDGATALDHLLIRGKWDTDVTLFVLEIGLALYNRGHAAGIREALHALENGATGGTRALRPAAIRRTTAEAMSPVPFQVPRSLDEMSMDDYFAFTDGVDFRRGPEKYFTRLRSLPLQTSMLANALSISDHYATKEIYSLFNRALHYPLFAIGKEVDFHQVSSLFLSKWARELPEILKLQVTFKGMDDLHKAIALKKAGKAVWGIGGNHVGTVVDSMPWMTPLASHMRTIANTNTWGRIVGLRKLMRDMGFAFIDKAAMKGRNIEKVQNQLIAQNAESEEVFLHFFPGAQRELTPFADLSAGILNYWVDEILETPKAAATAIETTRSFTFKRLSDWWNRSSKRSKPEMRLSASEWCRTGLLDSIYGDATIKREPINLLVIMSKGGLFVDPRMGGEGIWGHLKGRLMANPHRVGESVEYEFKSLTLDPATIAPEIKKMEDLKGSARTEFGKARSQFKQAVKRELIQMSGICDELHTYLDKYMRHEKFNEAFLRFHNITESPSVVRNKALSSLAWAKAILENPASDNDRFRLAEHVYGFLRTLASLPRERIGRDATRSVKEYGLAHLITKLSNCDFSQLADTAIQSEISLFNQWIATYRPRQYMQEKEILGILDQICTYRDKNKLADLGHMMD